MKPAAVQTGDIDPSRLIQGPESSVGKYSFCKLTLGLQECPVPAGSAPSQHTLSGHAGIVNIAV